MPLCGHRGPANGFESSGAGVVAAPGQGWRIFAGSSGANWSFAGSGSRFPLPSLSLKMFRSATPARA